MLGGGAGIRSAARPANAGAPRTRGYAPDRLDQVSSIGHCHPPRWDMPDTWIMNESAFVTSNEPAVTNRARTRFVTVVWLTVDGVPPLVGVDVDQQQIAARFERVDHAAACSFMTLE